MGTPQNLDKIIDPAVKVGDNIIKAKKEVKNIGAVFNENMKMNSHVSKICRTAWYKLSQISRIRQYLTQDECKTVVHAYITSVLDQNNSLLIGMPDSLIKKMQRIQNASAKLICGAKKIDHVTKLLEDLHWLPIRRRIDFKILLLTYKALHGLGPQYLQDLLIPYVPEYGLRSGDDNLLTVPHSKLKSYGDRSFQFIAPKLYNELPHHIRMCDSITSFKRSLKTYMFKLEYGL